MPSPLVEIKQGTGAYQAQANGFNATPGATITIHLIDSSADSWSIACISTDDLSDKAAINAAMTIDPIGKTATFTFPAFTGRALRFQSQVNQGTGPNDTIQTSYTTTFAIFSLTAESRRVLALDETTESNSTFGYIADLNNVIRNPAAGGTPAGPTGALETNAGGGAFGSLVGTTSGQVVTWNGTAWIASDAQTSGQTITAPDWWLDPVSGNDANAGTTSLTALKTWAGLEAKWGLAPELAPTGGTLTVHLLNSMPATDGITPRLFDLARDVTLVIQAESSAVTTNATGSITAATAHAGNTPWQITDPTIVSWATHVGRRGRVTSGLRAGTVFGILKDLGSNTARITQPVIPSAPGAAYAGLTLSTVQAGDPYVIESFPNIYLGELADVGAHPGSSATVLPGIQFKNFYLRNAGAGILEIRQTIATTFIDCRFEPTVEAILNDSIIFDGCMFDGGVVVALGFVDLNAGGVLSGASAALPGIAIDVESQGLASISQGTVCQGAIVHIHASGSCAVLDDGLGVYDGTLIAGVAVGGDNNAQEEGYLNVLGHLFGSGNVGYGVCVAPGCRMVWDGPAGDPSSGIVPTLTGASGDIVFGHAETTAWAFNKAGGKFLPNPIALSWANVSANVSAGGFGGSAHHPQLDAHIVRANDAPDAGVAPYVSTAVNLTVAIGVDVVETTASGVTVTLPAAPYTDQVVTVMGIVEAGTGAPAATPFVVNGNGKTINGAATYTQQIKSETARLTYNGTQWRLFEPWTSLTAGGATLSPQEKSASYTLVATDNMIVVVGSVVGLTMTLPATPTNGESHIVANQTASNVTVAGNTHNINGATTYTLVPNQTIELVYSSGSGIWVPR